MPIKDIERRLRNFLFLILLSPIVSLSAFSDVSDDVPFRVLSWSVNDGVVIVEYNGDLIELKKDALLDGTSYQLRSIQKNVVIFSGDNAIGEMLRIYLDAGTQKQKVHRTSLLPASK